MLQDDFIVCNDASSGPWQASRSRGGRGGRGRKSTHHLSPFTSCFQTVHWREPHQMAQVDTEACISDALRATCRVVHTVIHTEPVIMQSTFTHLKVTVINSDFASMCSLSASIIHPFYTVSVALHAHNYLRRVPYVWSPVLKQGGCDWSAVLKHFLSLYRNQFENVHSTNSEARTSKIYDGRLSWQLMINWIHQTPEGLISA